MIDRLEDEGSHGKMLVSKVLGYLAASRYGLAEDEIIDLLSRDLEMYKWFFEKSYHLPADLLKWSLVFLDSEKPLEMKDDQKYTSDQERVAINFLKEIRNPPEEVTKFLAKVLPEPKGPKLPVVLWSRLFFDLEPYLSERDSEGSTLLTFYHRELGEVSKSVYLDDGNEQQYHEKLADYFRFKADPKGNGSWTGSYLHGLSELPYHLTRAARYDEVHQTLTDFTFLERKTAEVGVLEHKDEKGNPVKTYTGVLQLQDDFEGALDAMPGDGESGSGDRSPLIVTAVDSGAGLSVYCPVCNKTSPVSRELLDTEITCPQKGCDTRLKINLFVINRS